MATIGTFNKQDNGFTGVIRTATLNLKARFVPAQGGGSDKAPDFRIFTGTTSPVEIGAAWTRSARDTGMKYLSCRLDDPTFAAPINASLVEDSTGPGLSLIWSRPRAD